MNLCPLKNNPPLLLLYDRFYKVSMYHLVLLSYQCVCNLKKNFLLDVLPTKKVCHTSASSKPCLSGTSFEWPPTIYCHFSLSGLILHVYVMANMSNVLPGHILG